MNYIRILSIADKKFLKELVYCHKRIFPDSVQNIFGDQYLMRSFYWFMLNHEKRGILVYEQEGRIIGFLTMRVSHDIDNFLKYIYKTVIRRFISRPTLLLNYLLLINTLYEPPRPRCRFINSLRRPPFFQLTPQPKK